MLSSTLVFGYWLLLHKQTKTPVPQPVSEIQQRASLSIPQAYTHTCCHLYCLLSACFLADIPVSLFFHTMMNDVYHLIAVHEIIWFIVFTLGVTMLKLYSRLISTQWSSPQFLCIFYSIVCVITSWVIVSSTFTQINIHSDDHFGHVIFFYLVLQSVPSTLTHTHKKENSEEHADKNPTSMCDSWSN